MTFAPLFPVLPYSLIVIAGLLVLIFLVFKDHKAGMLNGLAWTRRILIFGLVALIGYGPATIEEATEAARANVDVYFVVDRTGSMSAEDFNGAETRLSGVRRDAKEIVDTLEGSRFSIISFDSSSSRQIPLTTDTVAVKNWFDNLNPEITIYSSGSSVGRVNEELRRVLEIGAEENPQNQRVVIFMTDGEDTSDSVPSDFTIMAQYINGGAVLGYGTAEGGKMKEYDPYLVERGRDLEYIMDYSQSPAAPAVSHTDLDALNTLSDQLGIKFMHRTTADSVAPAVSDINPELVQSEGYRVVQVVQLLLWPFTIAIAALLAWELAASTSRLTRKVG